MYIQSLYSYKEYKRPKPLCKQFMNERFNQRIQITTLILLSLCIFLEEIFFQIRIFNYWYKLTRAFKFHQNHRQNNQNAIQRVIIELELYYWLHNIQWKGKLPWIWSVTPKSGFIELIWKLIENERCPWSQIKFHCTIEGY